MMVGNYGQIAYLLPKSNPAAGNTQRNADDEPNENQSQHSTERDSTAGTLGPHEQIKQEESAKDESRDQQGSHDDVALPGLAAKGLIGTCRHVPSNRTEEGVDQENGSSQESTIGGREETKKCECCQG